MYNARNVECITLSSVLMELLQQRTKSHNPEALFPTHSSNCFLFPTMKTLNHLRNQIDWWFLDNKVLSQFQ